MLFLLILCGLVSATACALLIRSGRRAARRYGDMPQRFHSGDVSRLGGVGMMAACSIGWFWVVVADTYVGQGLGVSMPPMQAAGWCVTAFIACCAGTADDISHSLKARWRLLLTLGAAVAGVVLLGAQIPRLGIPIIDALWASSRWPALLFAILAIAGLPHAFNLIDGYNGLAGAVSLICCFAVAYVALQVGDRQLAGVVLVLAGATAGFLVWNYPRGLIFAGDGGAYLWGVVIAVATIQLVQRHAEVSPWFAMLLLSYPVVEVVFSTYRKLVRGQSPGLPDALHIHQLIYRRIVREVFDDNEARRMLIRNNRTSPYLWGFASFTVVPAVLFWRNTTVLMVCCLGFVTLYVWIYTSIVRFRVPRWLRRTASR
jgi:UDP-N-acetylmuramyl pentapeptide phosphotransferase/UDP-N-acetylglucosamine-1-phosphate transferase